MKKMIPLAVALIIACASHQMFGQTKLLLMEDVVLGARRGTIPEKIDQLQWVPGTDQYSKLRKTGSVETLVTATAGSKEKEILDLSALNAVLKSKFNDSLPSFPEVKWKNKDVFTFDYKGKLASWQVSKKNLTFLLNEPEPDAENKEYNDQLTAQAYTKGNNLWINTATGNKPITNDTDPAIVNGQKVHREEFGIHKGTFWSPSGELLAYYRMDQTMVTDYPVLNLDEKPATATMVKYPMAGGLSHRVTIGIYNTVTDKTTFLKTGEPADQFLTNIAWSPDNTKLYVVILNREQNHLKFNRYDVATGNFEATLFEEKDDKYVHPVNAASFSKNGKTFVWLSRRDGFNHLYLYGTDGKVIRQLTKGNWEVAELLGWDASQKKFWFTAAIDKPINKDVAFVNVESGMMTKVTTREGVHKAKLNAYNNQIIDEYSSYEIPRIYSIVNEKGAVVSELLKSADPLKSFIPVNRKIFTIKNIEGDELYCKMVTPFPLDSTKQYPVIVYVYGGPNVQLVNNTWPTGTDMWYQYMAQRGYIVFTLENRGTPYRGKAFEQVTFRNLGDKEMSDQIAGVKWLMRQSFVDKNRMGVYGWSYGGFMTVSLMTRHPNVFKVAVAGGPVIDWSYYEIMYTERYMDTPIENPEGYQKSSLLNYVENLKGKMMLIHGTSDDVVVWQHSLMYLKKAVQKNVQLDYFVYPGHEHNVTGRDRVHLLNKISNYFFENLK